MLVNETMKRLENGVKVKGYVQVLNVKEVDYVKGFLGRGNWTVIKKGNAKFIATAAFGKNYNK